MEESGIVVETSGGMARVRFVRTSACGKCNACGFKKGQSETVIETPNTLRANVNDRVLLRMATRNMLGASALAYLFPLAMLIAGLAGGYAVAQAPGFFMDAEIFCAICGIVLTAGAFAVIRTLEPRIRKKNKNMFTMVSVIQERKGEDCHE